MAENSKIEYYTVTPGGASVSLHSIYCDCERRKPILCVFCGQPEKGHYRGETGTYCIGFYDSTKVFTPVLAAGERRA